MLKKILVPTIVLGMCAAALAACSGASTTLNITASDYKYDAESWTIPAGQTITLTLINNGSAEHEWVIVKKGETVTVPFDDDDEAKVFWEIEAAPGETKTETFTAPAEPGEYAIVCGTATHIEQGMTAKLTVK
jgi:plastocyanin